MTVGLIASGGSTGWWWVGVVVTAGISVFVGGAVILQRIATRRKEHDP